MKNRLKKLFPGITTAILLLTSLVSCGGTPGASTSKPSGGDNLEAPLVEFNLPEDYGAIEVSSLAEGGVLESFFKAKEELPDEITVLEPADVSNYPKSLENQLFVSPTGNDGKKGTKEAPLKSIATAVKKLRGMGGGVVYLLEGEYVESDGIVINADNSGTDKSPLFITPYQGADVTIAGSKSVDNELFTKVSETTLPSKLSNRLSDEAKANAVCVNLYDLGLEQSDLGMFDNKTRPVLNVDGVSQTIARYPNEGASELPINEVVDQGKITSTDSPYYETNK